ncbi:hypothetical protein SAMN04488502_101388 [Dendrosporobacter quercicolus]|uniref:Uncharacterized protein n=2 Tax=Dendrosporobacter quercicolus TaxID=146817 RepID=A0A1G9LLM7_9FIRM|nr:hypothetical protein SAMN04488502_101388 [Dendrosporobacter quercicolus]
MILCINSFMTNGGEEENKSMLDIIGGMIGVYFLIAMLSLFAYIIFKKGNWKKSLLHIGISVVLLTITVVASIQ